MNVDENLELMKRLIEALLYDAEKADIEEMKKFLEFLEGPLTEQEQNRLRMIKERIMKYVHEDIACKNSKHHD